MIRFTESVGCRARNAIQYYVAATKYSFRAHHEATALTTTAAVVHTSTQRRLRLKKRRASRKRMLKTMTDGIVNCEYCYDGCLLFTKC